MLKKRLAIVLLVVFGLLASVAAFLYWSDPARLTTAPKYTGLSRTVVANTLFSDRDPTVQITFDERYKYIGGQTFVLYGTADTEQHFFVEENPDGSLKAFFWIQFEAFLPDNPYTYDYSDSPMNLKIGDLDFFTDTAPGKTSRMFPLGQPGTDGYLARKFAADKGYSMPRYYSYSRHVHIPDEAHRKELLIIFMDDLSPTGYSAEGLREGGAHHDRWAQVESAHLEKIKQVMKPLRR